MKIMMNHNSINEIVKGAPNDTQHQNNANQSYRLWWVAADQCPKSNGTYIHIMI